MTAASGGPGGNPDHQGQPPSGYDIPPADPAYGWQPAVSPPPPPYPGYPAMYGAPHPGGYGYGYPGYPSYPGYPMSAEQGTNLLAIVSLVGSLVGVLCFVGSLVGVVTGVVAINQVKRTGEKGFGLAVAGTAAGVAGLLYFVVMVASKLGH